MLLKRIECSCLARVQTLACSRHLDSQEEATVSERKKKQKTKKKKQEGRLSESLD